MSKMVLMFSLTGVCFALTILGNGSSYRPKEGAYMNGPAERHNKLATGVWGGQHARVEVTGKGAAIEFDCANGTIDVKGKFAAEHGGPVRQEEEGNNRAVRYIGRVKDKELTLTISDLNTKENLGTFTLTLGNEGRLMKCR
jgi:hypothetical protein